MPAFKIDFLIGDNDYNSTSHFSRKLAAALRKRGVKTRLFWIGGGNFFKAFYKIQEERPDLTLSFSDVTLGNKAPLSSAWNIPHLSFLIDPAIYFLHHLKGIQNILASVDEEDVSFIKSLGFDSVYTFTHGVDEIDKRAEKKELDLLMLGTLHDFEKRRSSWEEKYPQKIATLLEEASMRVLTTNTSSLRALLEMGVQDQLPELHLELDLYTSGKARVELVRALKKFKVHIFGKGVWKKYLPNACLNPPVPFKKGLKLMSQAKIVLNTSPRFKNGSHERILYALAKHALPLTGESSFTKTQFPHQSLLTYAYGKEERIQDEVAVLLNDENQREKRVILGQKKLKSHFWEAKAEDLLKILSDKVLPFHNPSLL